MYELRILNGLHRGATLPLDDQPLVIGASEDADVVLVDPDIETRHATLTLRDGRWSLAVLDGMVLGAENNRPQDVLELEPGEFARLGHVWVTVADSEARWENPPPEPIDAPQEEPVAVAEPEPEPEPEPMQQQAEDQQQETEEEQSEELEPELEPALAQETVSGEDDLYSDSPLDGPLHEQQAEAVADESSTLQSRLRGKLRGTTGWRRSRMVLVPFALATVLSACAAYTMTSNSEEDTPFKKPDANPIQGAQTALATNGTPAAPAKVLAPIDLRDAFRERLKEVDLLKRFKLELQEKSWTMHAALDDEEAARFERVLAQFIRTHNITFPVNATVGSAEAMLPFRIRQVISGSNASVITHDGNRLYVGDEYRGVRLLAIEGNQLHFGGERNIKVKW